MKVMRIDVLPYRECEVFYETDDLYYIFDPVEDAWMWILKCKCKEIKK